MSVKLDISKEELERLYTIEKKSAKKIAKELDIAYNSVFNLLRRFNIPFKRPSTGMFYKDVDLSGQVFGDLTVIKYLGKTGKKVKIYSHECKCSCGRTIIVKTQRLLRDIKGCGRCAKTHGRFSGYLEISSTFWRNIVKGAAARDHKFNLDIKDAWELFIKQNRKCALTGREITFGKSVKDKIMQTASLDRIDSNKDYFLENVQWVHKNINFMKGRLSNEEFILLCKEVTKNNP